MLLLASIVMAPRSPPSWSSRSSCREEDAMIPMDGPAMARHEVHRTRRLERSVLVAEWPKMDHTPPVFMKGTRAVKTNLCACLLSSWRRVKAGLLSGLGPLRLGGWPSLKVSVNYPRVITMQIHTLGLLLVTAEIFEEVELAQRAC